jgi:hypothetical protein
MDYVAVAVSDKKLKELLKFYATYFKLNPQIQKFGKLVGLIIFARHKANRVDFLHLYKYQEICKIS